MTYPDNIEKLLEKGARSYAAKKFDDSVDDYGSACELYSELNDGEEDPQLLLLYGKALFQVAVSKNGLFGGAPAEESNKEEQKQEEEEESEPKNGLYQFSEDVPLAEEEDEDEEDEDEEEENNAEENEEDEEGNEEGDEGDKENEAGEEGENKEEPSDFEIAWDILDLARSLFQSQLDKYEDQTTTPIDDPTTSTEPLYQLKLNISNLHDILGEISLETENFKQAAEDFLSTLKLRSEIFTFKSNLISEIHYKISLALEFNHELEGSQQKAVKHLEKAIESIKQRDEKDDELIKELESRLVDLKKDPNELLDEQKKEILKGILGESTAPSTTETTETKVPNEQKVNDLTSMVKKRKTKKTDAGSDKKKTKV